MGLRKQTIFLSLISTLASPWAAALGLGEIKLKSTLNQPLNAEIQLTQTKDLTDREILVGLASQADFDRVGVDKPFFLGDLKFQVVMDPGQGPLVRITSSKPVVEPYLNFIIQAQWPSGKLLREYTVLVDLPVYGGEETQAVAPAVSRPAVDTPKVQTQLTSESTRPRASRPVAAAPRPKAPRPAPPEEAPIEAKPSGETYGPVVGNDTLWKIARSNRVSGASIQQTMLAIQKLNPDAFINGNINLLRKGETLRLPAGDAATEVAADEAARQVAATTTARKPPAEAPAGPQLDASKTVAKTEAKASTVEGRVKLSSSNSAESSKSGRGAGAEQGSKEALSNELTITKEELDAKSRESGDLNARLKAVDEQIENTEKLIQMNSEEMRKLELVIAKNKQTPAPAVPAETPAAPTEVPAAISADGKVVAPGTEPAAPNTEASVPKAEAVVKTESPVETPPATPKPAEAPAPKVSAPEPKGLIDQIKDNALYLGAGLAVILGGAFLFLKRRRKDDDNPAPWVDSHDSAGGDWGADFALPAFDDTQKSNETASALDDSTQMHFAPPSQGVKLETDDVVSESDIHIALNDFDTAEKLLLSSLEQDPANSRVLLKLLEVYSRKQDVESFDRQYAKLRAFCDEDSSSRAEQLRSYIDGAPPFDEHKYSDEAFFAAVNGKVAEDTTQIAPAVAASTVLLDTGFATEPFAGAFDFDAALEAPELEEPHLGDVTQILEPIADTSADADDDFTLEFDSAEVAPATDRRSLAELLSEEGGEDSLDLSDFDDLTFDKAAAPITSLDEPGDIPTDVLSDLDFSFDGDDLSEADFELDEDALALGSEFEASIAEGAGAQNSGAEDAGLDAGFDDLDDLMAPAAEVAQADEPEDEFADLDLSALDYDLPEQELTDDDSELDSLLTRADDVELAIEDDLDALASYGASPDSEDTTEKSILGAMAELDALDDPSFDLSDDLDLNEAALDDLDLASLATEDGALTEVDELLDDASDSALDKLLDFDASFGETEMAAASDETHETEPDEPSTPTLVMSAISDNDLRTADLDFDELDADLGALAAEFDGDLSDLDELDAPAEAGVGSPLMDEPVTQFGELDDVDPADILGDGPKERPPIDLEGFDDSVTFAIETPLTDLDDSEIADLGEDFADLTGELAAIDEDLVEFEGLDNLDELDDLDSLSDSQDALSIDLDDELVIPKFSAQEDASADFQLPDFDPESDDDSDLGALCDGDELDTKLDLLRAFVDMGDEDSARHTLEEILEEGSEEQRKQANALVARMG